METKQEDRLIYLQDLLFVVLYRYKQILWAMVALALLLGIGSAVTGMAALRDEAANAAAVEQYQIALDDYEDQKTQVNLQLERLEAELEEHAEYVGKSAYMQLDPYAHYEARVQLGVHTADDPAQTGAAYLLAAYRMHLTSQTVQQALAQAVGVGVADIDLLQVIEQEEDANTLCVRVKCDTNERASAALEVLKTQLDLASTQLQQQVGDHGLLVVEASAAQCTDMEVARAHTEVQQRIKTLREEYERLKKEAALITAPVLQIATAKSVIKRSVILAVVGAVVGAMLVAVWAWIVHLFDTHVYSARLLRNQTGVKILGCVAKGKHNKITAWLRKMEGRDTGDTAQRVQVLAADVRNRCGDSGMLLVTGDADVYSRESVVEALRAAMPGVQVEDKGSLLREAAAIEALAKCDAVLLVEQCGVSQYAGVEETCKKVVDYDKNIVGCILLGG